MYPAFRSVECNMEEVRMVGKRRIDRMYYLDTEQRQRYFNFSKILVETSEYFKMSETILCDDKI